MIQLNTDTRNLNTKVNLDGLILNEIGTAIYVKNNERKYVYINPAMQALFEQGREYIIGSDDSVFFDLDKQSKIRRSDLHVLEQGETLIDEDTYTLKSTLEVKVYCTEKTPIYNRNMDIIGLLGTFTDITELHNLKEELQKQTTIDALTGLYNRRFFLDTASRYFSEANRHKTPLSLIIMNIDLFTNINNKFGHLMGDSIISFVSDYILGELREEDVLARVSGVEFAILLPNVSFDSANILAERIRRSLAEKSVPVSEIGGVKPNLSIGVTANKASDNKFDEMYIRANKALLSTKNKS